MVTWDPMGSVLGLQPQTQTLPPITQHFSTKTKVLLRKTLARKFKARRPPTDFKRDTREGMAPTPQTLRGPAEPGGQDHRCRARPPVDTRVLGVLIWRRGVVSHA